ncbi:hypothetical protein CSA37_12015 [Candidatus Fermentibacteria bacterium]|nr:MAG: hypothetical protein CSA37_12015 [Candidatus Fermentibacteria bacterium]
MVFGELDEIRNAAEKAAEREGVPFYILRDTSKRTKAYTALTSVGFGLPPGFQIEELITPEHELEEIEPPEKISSNGF